METTKSRVVVEIRRFSIRPVYFRDRFVGGEMIKEVLILNPDDPDKWFCVKADMKKLPTEKWCKEYVHRNIPRSKTIIFRPREIDQGEIVWRGLVGKKRIDMLLELFKEEEEKRVSERKIQNYGRNNGTGPE